VPGRVRGSGGRGGAERRLPVAVAGCRWPGRLRAPPGVRVLGADVTGVCGVRVVVVALNAGCPLPVAGGRDGCVPRRGSGCWARDVTGVCGCGGVVVALSTGCPLRWLVAGAVVCPLGVSGCWARMSPGCGGRVVVVALNAGCPLPVAGGRDSCVPRRGSGCWARMSPGCGGRVVVVALNAGCPLWWLVAGSRGGCVPRWGCSGAGCGMSPGCVPGRVWGGSVGRGGAEHWVSVVLAGGRWPVAGGRWPVAGCWWPGRLRAPLGVFGCWVREVTGVCRGRGGAER